MLLLQPNLPLMFNPRHCSCSGRCMADILTWCAGFRMILLYGRQYGPQPTAPKAVPTANCRV
jgi:hypothetical protein